MIVTHTNIQGQKGRAALTEAVSLAFISTLLTTDAESSSMM